MSTRCVAHVVSATPRLQASKRQQTKQNFVTLPPQFEGDTLNKSSRRTGKRNQPGTGSNSSEESRGGGKGENWGVSPKPRSSSQLSPGVFFPPGELFRLLGVWNKRAQATTPRIEANPGKNESEGAQTCLSLFKRVINLCKKFSAAVAHFFL